MPMKSLYFSTKPRKLGRKSGEDSTSNVSMISLLHTSTVAEKDTAAEAAF